MHPLGYQFNVVLYECAEQRKAFGAGEKLELLTVTNVIGHEAIFRAPDHILMFGQGEAMLKVDVDGVLLVSLLGGIVVQAVVIHLERETRITGDGVAPAPQNVGSAGVVGWKRIWCRWGNMNRLVLGLPEAHRVRIPLQRECGGIIHIAIDAEPAAELVESIAMWMIPPHSRCKGM